MLPVSQNWRNAQKLQLRPEADVKIEFYSIATGSYSLTYIAEVNKNSISTFNYRGSGKVDNVNVPSFSINLELIKGTYANIERGYIAKLFFGFFVNNAWEYVEVNYFKVTEVSKPANGLVDKFVLKPISEESYTKQYTKGSNGGELDPIELLTRITGYAPNALAPSSMSAFTDLASFVDVYVGMGLEECSKIDALQLIGIACGKTLLVDSILTGQYQGATMYFNNSDIKYKTITPDLTNVNASYIIDPNNSYRFPELQNDTAIGSLIITQYTNTLGDVVHTYNEVFTSIQSRRWDKQFQELYYKITYSVEAGSFSPNSLFTGVRLDGYVAKWWALPLTAPARMEVYLYAMTTTGEQQTYSIGTGEDFYVDNPLVNENYITPCSDYLKAWLPYQNYIECDYRIDPRIELFDKICVFDKSGNIYVAVVEDFTINFNGGFTGKMRGRIIGSITETIAPEVHVDDYYTQDWSFRIINNNPFDVDVLITYSSFYTPLRYTLGAGETLTLDYSNCRQLRASFEAYANQDLNDYVTCRFDNDEYGESTHTIILEANA